VKAIGLANFFPDRVMDFLVHHEIAPAVYQIETHPFLQQRDAQAFLRDNGVQIESWGPFAEGQHGIFNNEVLRAIAEEHDHTVAHPKTRRCASSARSAKRASRPFGASRGDSRRGAMSAQCLPHCPARPKLLCLSRGCFGGAGKPVMGHSGEGELL
jgi:aryl-alcohol dehydrogenase-like predicted oxidoreductase